MHALLRSIRTGDRYAVKGFKLHGVSQEKLQELRDEAEIFLAMDHPHVARLVDVYESQHRLDLVMECMDGGEACGPHPSTDQTSNGKVVCPRAPCLAVEGAGACVRVREDVFVK